MKKIRLAIIGQGRSGRDIHGKYFRCEDNTLFDVAAVVEKDPARRELALKEYPGCEVFEDYTELFGKNLKALLNDEEVELPSFNFITARREWCGKKLKLNEDSVIIVEGIHGLNPTLLPADLDPKLVFRLYVTPLLALNLDDHNRIPSSYLRLLRRTVRDFESRGSSVQKTLAMWDSVRRGEERWIFPFQENADVILNSSTLYELCVIKKHIYPLLTPIDASDECYDQVRAMVKVLNYVLEADVDDEIPPTSIVREFIGGNSFYK